MIALVIVAAAAVGLGALRAARMWLRAPPVAEVDDLRDSTTTDARGAVRSVQAADLCLPAADLAAIWSPAHLERLARTYWRFLSRVTLGLVHVVYGEDERYIVLLHPRLRLITFRSPEYEMDDRRGVVRWWIDRGLLVARDGRGGTGHLQIAVERDPAETAPRARLHVEVEVANFYPAIAAGFGRWIYEQTQSRIHVIVTHAFLRSLARLDLEESRVGRYAEPPPQTPDSPEPDRDLATRK
jgi:hypothetical protein